MVFSSIIFLLYFAPVFFLVYYLLPEKLKNIWIIISSLLFYWWGAPSFIVILIISCFLDYYLSQLYLKYKNPFLFYLAIISNVGLLIYFKYWNFFIENISLLTNSSIEWTKVILPIGISFLTFQKISYLVDVKRSKGELQTKFHNYLLYVVLFPQLIAGPIVRYKEISNQITDRFKEINYNNIYLGLRRFVIGLSKKVLIANVLGETVDALFKLPPDEISTPAVILGIFTYSFQIYFDFSGYSDMAIGLGRMMGFEFPENFNFPYISRNITEFWKRWHITLSNWMRDYLYIPLGGNRINEYRTYLNLIIVFLISGFWHGASWNFIVWGAYHGLFLVLERLFMTRLTRSIPYLIKVITTFIIVSLGWLLFRVDSLGEAFEYISSLNNYHLSMNNWSQLFTTKFYCIFILAAIFSFMGSFFEEKLNRINFHLPASQLKITGSVIITLILFTLSLGELFASGFNPFIYFKF